MRNSILVLSLVALLTLAAACSTANDGSQSADTVGEQAQVMDQSGQDMSGQDMVGQEQDGEQYQDDEGQQDEQGDQNENDDQDQDEQAQDDEQQQGDQDQNQDGQDDEQDQDDSEQGAEAESDDDDAAGLGMANRRNEDAQHREMLDEAMALGLITEDDATFFLELHEVLDEVSPRPMGEDHMAGSADTEAMKQLQRSRTDAAVAAGAISQEDADRFTAIHDILIDNGLMDD
ncbi:MAG: hypothetical protein ACK2T6_08270 [Anaerolineae bacterium]